MTPPAIGKKAAPVPAPSRAGASLVAVVDSSDDRQRLLASTLFSLGCRVLPVDCQADRGGAIRLQIRAGSPDVVIWQLTPGHGASTAPLLSMLESGGLDGVGVIVAAADPADAMLRLRGHGVYVLPTPIAPVSLMKAVSAAHADRLTATASSGAQFPRAH